MLNENGIKFFEELKTSDKAREIMQKHKAPANAEEAAAIYTQIARELGYELTEEELKEFVREKEQMQKRQTGAAAENIEQLMDEDLDQVAGGKAGNSECDFTYLDYENCWFMDGCDNTLLYYEEYKCARHNLGRQTDS